jgi:hypothetical protein
LPAFLRYAELKATKSSRHLIFWTGDQRMSETTRDEDAGKGAVEQDKPQQDTNTSMAGQNGHRDQDPRLKSANSDFPEPGENEEHTGEPNASGPKQEKAVQPEGTQEDSTPGFRQKTNQNQSKDDPLAA